MTELIDFMPGIDMPVGSVSGHISKMWEDSSENPLSEFRASQMNLVLHFGREVTPKKARERFEIAVRFAQRYPSRIIVLCPYLQQTEGMRAKLFSQCYIGETHREMCCCEALLLAYSSEDNGFLFNQVSVWLESDLPTYHWFSEVRTERVIKYFNNLLKRVDRIVYDSNIESPNFSTINWPMPQKVVDLAKARLLPIRQAIGQYLSSFSINTLTDQLSSIEVLYVKKRKGEAFHLIDWLNSSLKSKQKEEIKLYKTVWEIQSKEQLGFIIKYTDGRFIKWSQNLDILITELSHNLCGQVENLPIQIKPMNPEQELSEAFYF